MDTKLFYIYLINNLVNGKIYIGKTYNPTRRWIMHRNFAKKNSSVPRFNYPLYKSMRKNGISNFRFDIIETHQLEEDALEAEKWWIAYLRSLGATLYNLTDGGEGTSGRQHSEETRRKISQSNMGNQSRFGQTNSTEHRAKISVALKGKTYTKKRKDNWYQNSHQKVLPNGLSGIEKERNKKSEMFKGEGGPNVKLNEQQVREIKQLMKDGLSCVAIATMFSVGKSCIGDISSGRCWSHIII
jgi:group I intron endonuclease